jgi:predicted hydrolase (HD superfamily)
MDFTPKSLNKKWKNKAFAAGFDRSIIGKGAALLGARMSELFEDAIMGMRQVTEAIGLKGNLCGPPRSTLF